MTIAKGQPKAATSQSEQQQNGTRPDPTPQQRHNSTVVSDGQEHQSLQAISAATSAPAALLPQHWAELQESEPTPYPLADDIWDASHAAASVINARLAQYGLALTADDFEAVRDAVADSLQTAEVVEAEL